MFIAVDLKVVEGLSDSVARAADVSADRILASLVRLWHRCWADELDTLNRSELAGVFGLDRLDAVIEALEAFGFLHAGEPVTALTWRVKGAARYLRLKDSRRRGAAATNALKARSRATHKHALERGLSDAQTRSLTESPSHRVTEIKSIAGESCPPPVKAPKRPPADARLQPLTEALVEAYAVARGSRYAHGGAKDAVALKALLPVATDVEILARWRNGLDATGWASCSTFAQLRSKWNDLAQPAAPTKASDVREPPPRSAEETKRYMAELREKQGWNR